MTEALADWARVAPSLGLDARAFRPRLIWQKQDAQRSHVVLRLSGPRALILKRVFLAPDDAELPATVRALMDAHDRLANDEFAHAPEVLFASKDGSLVIMAEARGKTLEAHLTGGRDHRDMLRRTGAWLSAFHASAETENRTYQPRFMVGHIARMARAVADKPNMVALPELFMACAERVPDIAAQAMDQSTVSAVKHGDFNLRNIVLGPDGATGLDFKPCSTAPVGFDIARILVDYAALFQPDQGIAPGSVLADATLDAFFEGYQLVGRDDPAVRFVPFVQLLNDWRLIPPDSAARSWRQVARMRAIEGLARNAFGIT